MFVFILTGTALLAWGSHMLLRRDQSRAARLGLGLKYFFCMVVGIGGLCGFTGHAFFAESVAISIGWPPGNPFQTEVAVTNLMLGILGFGCLRFGSDFWLATAIAWATFFWGAGVVHLIDINSTGNLSYNNAGPILYADLVLPFLLLILVHRHRRAESLAE